MNDKEILLKINRKFSEVEAVRAVNEENKKLQYEIGVLKSDVAFLEHKYKGKQKSPNFIMQEKIKKQKEEIRNLLAENRDLKHQLIASGVPLPKRYAK